MNGVTSGSNGSGFSLAVDPALGDVYIAGSFVGTIDFDPGIGTFTMTSGAPNDNDAFICKLSHSGNFLWAKSFTGTDDAIAEDITIDQSGNVYTTGWFNGITDFDPNAGTFNLTGSGDIFVSKLDNAGNFV